MNGPLPATVSLLMRRRMEGLTLSAIGTSRTAEIKLLASSVSKTDWSHLRGISGFRAFRWGVPRLATVGAIGNNFVGRALHKHQSNFKEERELAFGRFTEDPWPS
jgi:hypothetical protein